jgi:hypothetical protein
MTDNIIPLKKTDPKADAIIVRLNQISSILEWSSKMHSEGRMPQDVAQAFAAHFGYSLGPAG